MDKYLQGLRLLTNVRSAPRAAIYHGTAQEFFSFAIKSPAPTVKYSQKKYAV